MPDHKPLSKSKPKAPEPGKLAVPETDTTAKAVGTMAKMLANMAGPRKEDTGKGK
jgi:hypothetical protein